MFHKPNTTADALAARARDEAAMWTLLDSSDSIADANTRRAVAGLIMSAINNANDTVDVELAAGVEDWGYLARASLRGLIDCGGDSITTAVRAWFTAESRKAVQA